MRVDCTELQQAVCCLRCQGSQRSQWSLPRSLLYLTLRTALVFEVYILTHVNVTSVRICEEVERLQCNSLRISTKNNNNNNKPQTTNQPTNQPNKQTNKKPTPKQTHTHTHTKQQQTNKTILDLCQKPMQLQALSINKRTNKRERERERGGKKKLGF